MKSLTFSLSAILFALGAPACSPPAPPEADASLDARTNPCLVDNGGCSEDATCSDDFGGRTCSCNAGLFGDGLRCFPLVLGAQEAFIKPAPTTAFEPIEYFGGALALSADGNTLAVSSTNAVHRVAIYVRSGTAWTFEQLIEPPNNARAIALSGDGLTMAVGMEGDPTPGTGTMPGGPATGSVGVWARAGSTWSLQTTLRADTGEFDYFGNAVSLSADGNTLAVGANLADGRDESPQATGAVFVFGRTGGSWAPQAELRGELLTEGESLYFGTSIDLSSDGATLVVGAPALSTGGAAFVFSRVGSTWSMQSSLVPPQLDAGDRFGAAITISGDGSRIAVGAPLEDGLGIGTRSDPNNLRGDIGAVYLFRREAAAWVVDAYVKPGVGPARADHFGESVVLDEDGSALVVGVPADSSASTGIGASIQGDAEESGAVHRFVRTDELWYFHTYVKASNSGSGDRFGSAVALSSDGSVIAVGAPGEDSSARGVASSFDEGGPDSGAVYVFR